MEQRGTAAGASLTAWARTATFPDPIRLGDVEAEVLSRPVRVDAVRRESSLGGRIVLLIIASLFLIAPGVLGVVGLLLADRATTADDIDSWLTGSRVGYMLATAFPVGVLTMWFTVYGRHRTGYEILVGVASAVTGVAGLVAVAAGELDVPGHLVVWIVLAIVAGTACTGFAIFASRSGPPPERVPDHVLAGSETERLQFRDRTLVLHVLRDRGLVDDATWRRALEMPLGTWHRLDH
ncbi:hypothetical protein GCM10010921_16350 [Microbacterium album]|uniref:Uncharacterized protein n=2 Tax=Microbacterium album TaxID=2053191 RepID=A0A917IEV6_9MICO|nr:hypothetical protein GCM10010921_16350 [Microbacterium album]